jgi:predicted small integral membrane protein
VLQKYYLIFLNEMEGWNTTNSTSKRELFAQVRFDLHGFIRYFFTLLSVLYIHFIYLKLSSNVLLANSHIASSAESPLKSDSL